MQKCYVECIHSITFCLYVQMLRIHKNAEAYLTSETNLNIFQLTDRKNKPKTRKKKGQKPLHCSFRDHKVEGSRRTGVVRPLREHAMSCQTV